VASATDAQAHADAQASVQATPGRAILTPDRSVGGSGLRLQRRAMLARDADGRPVLWVERSSQPIAGAAASLLRFDVLAEDRQELR
jgi:hypothetical protein